MRSVWEAINTRQHPERLSVAILPKPFDREAFAANPSTYLDIVEPARVLQSATPGEKVPALEMVSPYCQDVAQGKSVEISVRAEPGMPVSFLIYSGGYFSETRLNAATVRADGGGNATVTYVSTPGVINDVQIKASAPTCSGVADFLVRVWLPEVMDIPLTLSK